MKLITMMVAMALTSSWIFAQKADHPDKGKKYPSCYKEGVVVNGSSPEWENSLFLFNKQAQVNYAMANDTVALYFCVRIADEAEQMKVLRNGIELRFNSRGKKKAEAILHFPIGGKTDGGRLDPLSQHDRKTMHLMFLLQMQDMELSGFKDGMNGFQGIKSGKNGILAAVSWDSTNVMVYEARIPFNAFAEDIRASEPLSVGIIIKGAPKPRQGHGDGSQDNGLSDMQGGQAMGQQPGMQHGAGRGMQQGSMHGYGENQKSFEDDEIWRLIVIAKKE